jgi:hypothetical protein
VPSEELVCRTNHTPFCIWLRVQGAFIDAVLSNRFPVPIIFEEPSLGVVVVIEAPWGERFAGRFEDEGFLVLGDLDPGHFVGLGLGEGGAHAKEGRKH